MDFVLLAMRSSELLSGERLDDIIRVLKPGGTIIVQFSVEKVYLDLNIDI